MWIVLVNEIELIDRGRSSTLNLSDTLNSWKCFRGIQKQDFVKAVFHKHCISKNNTLKVLQGIIKRFMEEKTSSVRLQNISSCSLRKVSQCGNFEIRRRFLQRFSSQSKFKDRLVEFSTSKEIFSACKKVLINFCFNG